MNVKIYHANNATLDHYLLYHSESNNRKLQFSLYLAIGIVLLSANLPIVCTILFQKSLRRTKEYVIIGGLALADAWTGLSMLTGSAQRLTMLFEHTGSFYRGFICKKCGILHLT